ncbi:MAG: hypothetical protein Kow00109_09110 [Acidobacteriota bacterium]
MMPDIVGMVLAAGWGTRLQPLTLLRAKAAVPLAGRPVISYALDLLREAGVDQVVVNVSHLAATVREAAAGAGLEIAFSEEPEPLGTGGALRRARDFLRGRRVVVINGKIFFGGRLEPLLGFHEATGSAATLVLVPRPPDSPFTPVWVDASGRIHGFGARPERNPAADRLTAAVFTGIQVIERSCLESLPEGFSDLVRDLYVPLLESGARVSGFLSTDAWFEISTPRRYLEASVALERRRGLAEPESGPAGSRTGGAAETLPGLRECVVWEGVQVPPSAVAERTIFAGGAGWPETRRWKERILTPGGGWLERLAQRNDISVDPCYIAWPLDGIRPLSPEELQWLGDG